MSTPTVDIRTELMYCESAQAGTTRNFQLLFEKPNSAWIHGQGENK